MLTIACRIIRRKVHLPRFTTSLRSLLLRSQGEASETVEDYHHHTRGRNLDAVL
jgi:hypothetical protein